MHRSLGITIEEMLNLEIMKDAKILAGHEGLGNKVTKMNVMEVPDIIDWVTMGEFLLTTAYSIKDDIEILKKLIPQMKEKGMAGFGIKMKRYVETLPQEIIALADELKFPIIEIPFHVSYTDVIMPVMTEIINAQTNTLIKIDETHNQLMNILLRGGEIEQIAQAIGQSVGNAVCIWDTVFDTVVTCCEEEKKEEIRSIIQSEDISAYGGMPWIFGEEILVNKEDVLAGKTVNRIQIPIYVDERHFGYLFVWEDQKKLSAVEHTAIEAAIPLIALNLNKKTSIFEIESRHKIEFFDDLLSKDEKRQRKALERSAFFDFDSKLGYAAIVIKINNIRGFIKETLNNSNFLYQLNGKILQIVERLGRQRKEKIIFGNKSDQIILLFGTDHGESSVTVKKELMQFSQDVIRYIESEMREVTCSIGLGRFYKETTDLWRSYGEATKAVQNMSNHKKNTMVHFDDLGIYRVLCFDEMEEELTQFYREILQSLVNYDAEKESELVKTLQIYFQCGGNLKKISEEMYTHYNTVIYRIQRIKEITRMDLENPDDRLNLQVALKILELMKLNKNQN